MSNVTFETATRLKDAGFPQPKPEPGQTWFYPIDGCMTIVETGQWHSLKLIRVFNESGCGEYETGQIIEHGAFAPDVEDITALLPSVFTLEMREGRHSCKIDTWQNLVQTQADNFAEAAALAWIALNTPQ